MEGVYQNLVALTLVAGLPLLSWFVSGPKRNAHDFLFLLGAGLFASRIILDVSSKFDVSAMAGVMVSPEDNVRDEVYGVEVGYLVKENVWLSLGHNFSGFYDRDLSGRDPTQSGWYIRMRMKFDEKLLKSAED